MTYTHNTYDRRVLVGASRRRYEDAKVLAHAQRWSGAIYLGGYAIECALKALLCYLEGKNNVQETRAYRTNEKRVITHNLMVLSLIDPLRNNIHRQIELDKTGTYRLAWNFICTYWDTNQLRYWNKQGNQDVCKRFLESVDLFHSYILRLQGE